MAKEQKQTQDSAHVPDTSTALGPPKSYRLYVTLGLAAVILCQMIVLWLLLPSRNAAQGQMVSGPPLMTASSSEPMVEVPLQKDPFKVKQVRGEETENLTLRMYVLVKKKDASKFTKQYAQYTQRVIDGVEEILHASSRAERQEPGRNTIKEKSKKEINEVLGTPLVQQVLISEYNFSVE